jgi:hypothetical protein
LATLTIVSASTATIPIQIQRLFMAPLWRARPEAAFVGLRMPFASTSGDHHAMSKHHHAVVWIDHKQARVMHFNADESDLETVHGSRPNVHLHHKANSIDGGHAPVDKKYLERVAQAIAHAGAVLIVGPASAKTELRTFLEQAHPAVAARVSAVEPMDHPTDGQLLAHARHFFRADDRMHSQIRT